MQTKRNSMIEQATQVGIKFCTATLLWMAIRPFAMTVYPVVITLIFSVHSFILGYLIRRVFNRGEVAHD